MAPSPPTPPGPVVLVRGNFRSVSSTCWLSLSTARCLQRLRLSPVQSESRGGWGVAGRVPWKLGVSGGAQAGLMGNWCKVGKGSSVGPFLSFFYLPEEFHPSF